MKTLITSTLRNPHTGEAFFVKESVWICDLLESCWKENPEKLTTFFEQWKQDLSEKDNDVVDVILRMIKKNNWESVFALVFYELDAERMIYDDNSSAKYQQVKKEDCWILIEEI